MAATWAGWANQFLTRANIIETPPNRTFLDQWAAHAPGSCKNNPVDLSQAVAGSSRCGDTVGPFGRSQNYGTHAEAAHAFAIQMGAGWVKPLLDALNSGNPFQIGDRSQVIAVLNRWGSTSFAQWYANAGTDGSTGSGSGSGTNAPHVHTAWHDLRRTVNHNWPVSIRHSAAATNGAWRKLGRGSRVH